MPVLRDDDSINGWQGFSYYMGEFWPVPKYWREVQRNPWALFISFFPSTNGLMLLAPVVLFRWPRWASWLGGFLPFGGLVPAFGFMEMILRNQLRVGFYCWVSSIFLMALLCLLDWTRQRRICRRES